MDFKNWLESIKDYFSFSSIYNESDFYIIEKLRHEIAVESNEFKYSFRKIFKKLIRRRAIDLFAIASIKTYISYSRTQSYNHIIGQKLKRSPWYGVLDIKDIVRNLYDLKSLAIYVDGNTLWMKNERMSAIDIFKNLQFKLLQIDERLENKNLFDKESEFCTRCGGTGYLEEYKHVQDGICFKCNGRQMKNN